jgi:hypothetical protein
MCLGFFIEHLNFSQINQTKHNSMNKFLKSSQRFCILKLLKEKQILVVHFSTAALLVDLKAR